MKKNILAIVIAVLALIISCKSTDKGKTKDKVKDGVGKIYWQDGSVKGEGTFKNYKMDGKWVLFHKNSNIKLAEGMYKDDKQEGTWTFFHKNGQRSTEGTFLNGQKSGEWLRYYDTGEKFAKENYVISTITLSGFSQQVGAIEGLRQTYYKSGNVKSEENYRNGLKNGITREYYIDGKPQEFSKYKDDKYDGKVNKFWPNGRKKEQSYYVEGNKSGQFRTFHDNGSEYISGDYQDGMMTGNWKFYSRDKRLMKEGNYKIINIGGKKSSKESGLWTFYEYSGNRKMTAMELTLNAGMVSGKCRVFEDGNFQGEGQLNGIPKAIFEIYKAGTKTGEIESAEFPPDDGKNNITHKWTGKWKKLKRNGSWTEFYPDGNKKKFEANFMMDKMNGKYMEYYPNGKIKVLGEYMNNKRNGDFKFYNPDGSIDSVNSGRYMLDKKSNF